MSAYGPTYAKECQVPDVTNTTSISGACGISGVRYKFHETEMAVAVRSLHSLHNGEVTSACLNPSRLASPRKIFTDLELKFCRVYAGRCRVKCDVSIEPPVQSVCRGRVSRQRLLIVSLSWFIWTTLTEVFPCFFLSCTAMPE